MKNIMLVACVAVSCSGCAFTSQQLKVTPTLNATSTVSGEGKPVQLTVVDERPSKVVGQRGVGGAGADMTVEGDLQGVITTAIATGLQKHNFTTAAAAASSTAAKLHVEIRNLDAKNIMGFWAGTLRDEFGVKGICKSPKGDYERLYNGLFETSLQFVPSADANNNYISSAVSDALNKLINDDALLQCLANG